MIEALFACIVMVEPQTHAPFFAAVFHRGRKRAALLYVVTYSLSCFTKHSKRFKVLLLGRLLGGVATSLLFRYARVVELNLLAGIGAVASSSSQ
jgi:hypothetical protein